jgi:YD repeat-containing protein
LSSSKINYSTAFAGNVSYLPQTITTSKGNNALEARVRYNAYDEFSKPLEVQQENGTIISYIYGYNQTLPVAKLENMAYGSIPANLITAIQSATNTGTEASVITALNALRTNVNLANAMITTFTYKPLIGVSTITDPKGDTITYEYDSFGRLSTVKDKNGNILSENQYNYRTQN